MMKHSINSLARALYEGSPTLLNLAENMARQYGRARKLFFFNMMEEDVQFFWKDIARQIIDHSKEWQTHDGICILSEKERIRLKKLQHGTPIVLCKDGKICPHYPYGCCSGYTDYEENEIKGDRNVQMSSL